VCSVVDLDPDESVINSGPLLIRIRIGSANRDPDPGGQKSPQKRKFTEISCGVVVESKNRTKIKHIGGEGVGCLMWGVDSLVQVKLLSRGLLLIAF
jgi:hypothetical protein